MKLILSGGGDSEHFKALDQHFLSLMSENPTLLFMPVAGDPETFGDCHERIIDTFSSIHFENIEMCLDLNELVWEDLKRFDAVYIDGGNTFQLMQQIRFSHFYELIYRFLHHGGIVNGDSAGAIILGSHIETAHFGEVGDENEVELISYQGLNLLGSLSIHCHYDEETDQEEILQFQREFGFPVLALEEIAGVVIEGSTLKNLSEGQAALFVNGQKNVIGPQQSLNLNNFRLIFGLSD